jgi:Formate hydrogenlyase subunit 6/NADH:ubiquinone oxidoreductase 23 kD subunit (chain I)
MLMTRTIISNLVHKYSTRLHPFVVRPPLPGSRGELEFDADTCILCKICERKCPSKVITVNLVEAKWGLNVMGCVNCGVCADVCPTKSIIMTENYRAPLVERTSQTYQCKPRKKKSAAKGESEPEGE